MPWTYEFPMSGKEYPLDTAFEESSEEVKSSIRQNTLNDWKSHKTRMYMKMDAALPWIEIEWSDHLTGDLLAKLLTEFTYNELVTDLLLTRCNFTVLKRRKALNPLFESKKRFFENYSIYIEFKKNHTLMIYVIYYINENMPKPLEASLNAHHTIHYDKKGNIIFDTSIPSHTFVRIDSTYSITFSKQLQTVTWKPCEKIITVDERIDELCPTLKPRHETGYLIAHLLFWPGLLLLTLGNTLISLLGVLCISIGAISHLITMNINPKQISHFPPTQPFEISSQKLMLGKPIQSETENNAVTELVNESENGTDFIATKHK